MRARRGRPRSGVREAVLAATEATLKEVGVARLSTKEVAQRAGVAESSIFYHFGDRLGLLQAVVQQYLPPVKQVLNDLNRRGDLRSDLVDLVEALEEFFLATAPIAAAIQSDADLRAGFAERSQELDIGPHRAVDAVVSRLEAERLPGSADIHAMALLMVGLAHQRALQRQLSPSHAAGLPTARAGVDVLIASIHSGPQTSAVSGFSAANSAAQSGSEDSASS